MKVLPRIRWMFLLTLLLLSVDKVHGNRGGAAAAAAETDEDEELHLQVLQETLAAGRGHRDEPGVRDQWESTAHLGQKVDLHKDKPMSPKIRALLKSYRLDCDGCDEKQAVAKINAFVKETKRQAEQQARQQSWLERAASLATLLVLGGIIAYFYYRSQGTDDSVGSTFYTMGSGGASTLGQGRRLEIEEQRRRAARKEEEAKLLAAQAKQPPNWREKEEKEVWTPKQETQFTKALAAFGGVPPKARYTLIADKVDGKNRQECLMHHKLLQLLAKEQ